MIFAPAGEFRTSWVQCDRCKREHWQAFVNAEQAAAWIEECEEDYEEYGQFFDRVERRSKVFHMTTDDKLLCLHCVDELLLKPFQTPLFAKAESSVNA